MHLCSEQTRARGKETDLDCHLQAVRACTRLHTSLSLQNDCQKHGAASVRNPAATQLGYGVCESKNFEGPLAEGPQKAAEIAMKRDRCAHTRNCLVQLLDIVSMSASEKVATDDITQEMFKKQTPS